MEDWWEAVGGFEAEGWWVLPQFVHVVMEAAVLPSGDWKAPAVGYPSSPAVVEADAALRRPV